MRSRRRIAVTAIGSLLGALLGVLSPASAQTAYMYSSTSRGAHAFDVASGAGTAVYRGADDISYTTALSSLTDDSWYYYLCEPVGSRYWTFAKYPTVTYCGRACEDRGYLVQYRTFDPSGTHICGTLLIRRHFAPQALSRCIT